MSAADADLAHLTDEERAWYEESKRQHTMSSAFVSLSLVKLADARRRAVDLEKELIRLEGWAYQRADQIERAERRVADLEAALRAAPAMPLVSTMSRVQLDAWARVYREWIDAALAASAEREVGT